MSAGTTVTLDAVDARILKELQGDGRMAVAELARRVQMSSSAVAERVRRLEEAGVIRGYAASVDPDKLGYAILAHLRLRYPGSNYKPLRELIAATPEVVEAHHVTGDDCFVLKVVATSMRHLEQVSGRIGSMGRVTTSVVYSSLLEGRPLLPPGAQTAKPGTD